MLQAANLPTGLSISPYSGIEGRNILFAMALHLTQIRRLCNGRDSSNYLGFACDSPLRCLARLQGSLQSPSSACWSCRGDFLSVSALFVFLSAGFARKRFGSHPVSQCFYGLNCRSNISSCAGGRFRCDLASCRQSARSSRVGGIPRFSSSSCCCWLNTSAGWPSITS